MNFYQCQRHRPKVVYRCQGFSVIAGVVDTGDKFIAGDEDTGYKFIASDIDAGD